MSKKLFLDLFILISSVPVACNALISSIQFVVGCGLRVHFWHDHWCGERPLRFGFPLLFSLYRCKKTLVAVCLEGGFGFGVWNV